MLVFIANTNLWLLNNVGTTFATTRSEVVVIAAQRTAPLIILIVVVLVMIVIIVAALQSGLLAASQDMTMLLVVNVGQPVWLLNLLLHLGVLLYVDVGTAGCFFGDAV